MRNRVVAICVGLFAASPSLGAQQLRGTVRDSASRLPLNGAVLTLFDSAGKPVMRGVSNANGIYDIPLLASATRGRIVRLGYRPRELRIPGKTGITTQFDLALAWLPTILEPVVALANPHCPRRTDAAATQALLEQTRAGLLTSIVQRESDPPSLVLYSVERNMEGTGSRIKFQDVWRDSIPSSPASFVSVYSATDFLTRGFMQNDETGQRYFAPDAEVLLDDQFTLGYCFRIIGSDTSRPRQVGLGFKAANRRRNRVDIDGAVWIDTSARVLRDIEYRYVGFPSRIERLDPGGKISFRELAGGQTLIEHWTMRIIGARYDTTLFAGGYAPRIDETLFAFEKGGQIAHATWRDGRAWHAPLGTLRLRVLTSDSLPAVGVTMYLPYTPYHAVVDSSGVFEVVDLISGPYSLLVIDPRLAPLNLDIPTSFDFVAANDSTVRADLRIQSAEEWVIARCATAREFVGVDTTLVFGRIFNVKGLPVGNVGVSAWTDLLPPNLVRTKEQLIGRRPVGGFTTGTDGLFQFCTARLGATIDVGAIQRNATGAKRQVPVTGRLTIVPLVIPQKQ